MKLATARGENRSDSLFATLLFVAGILIAARYQWALWTLDPDGMSVVSLKLPYWDFSNLWGGTVLAWKGQLAALFEPEVYRAALREMFGDALADQEWSYPPSMLLIGTPFSWMPIFPAYLVWTFGTAMALFFATKPLRLPLAGRIAIVLSPAMWINAEFGQNGALTGALLIGGLGLLSTSPILGGVLIGLLTIKPHLGLLLPFCILASRNWRALASATATALLLFVATGFIFGFRVWSDFWFHTRPLMTGIMNAPFPQPYHSNAVTVFATARSLGASVPLAYACQALAALCCIAVVCWIWRPENKMPNAQRVCLTGLLALLATPYGYSYDCIPLAVAMVWLFFAGQRVLLAAAGLIYLFPLVANVPNHFGFFITPLVLIAAALMVARSPN